MTRSIAALLPLPLLLVAAACGKPPPPKPGITADGRIVYPHAPRGEQRDVYHGVEIADPYRWLEEVDAPATVEWVRQQNALTEQYLAPVPARAAIKKRLTELWSFPRQGVPLKRGAHYFFTKNDGLQDQDVLYIADALPGPARVLLDPNTMAADGTVSLTGYAPSWDGKLVAYGLQIAGSDWAIWKVRNVETGRDLPDTLKWIKFTGVAWTHDSEGFYYSRYPKPKKGEMREQPNYFNKLYYHRLGTEQRADRLIYGRDDEKQWSFSPEVSDDGTYLVISVSRGTDDRNMILTQRLDELDGRIKPLIDHFDAAFDFLGNDGPRFYFRTTEAAPRGRVVAIDLGAPAITEWREVIGQKHSTLESAALVGDQLVAVYLRDAYNAVELYDRDGNLLRELELPGIGSVWGFAGERRDSETFYAYSSFTTPTTIFRYDLVKQQSSVLAKPAVAFNPDDYVTEQLFATSRDGTRVPLFVSHKKGLKPNGDLPVYLYGYGGFNIALTPWFRVAPLVWMEMGGVYAVACARGGGEYGEEWHDAGRLHQKQNTIDDFIAAAQHLIDAGYTRPARLAIGGASNGGLLVGASLVQRPDLFGAALPAVGVFDMLRFHKFTIGWAWVDDYGSADDPRMFQTLRAYSPLHNARPQAYPPVLLTTADHDDRVVPGHSFKFAATLQQAQTGAAPVLLRVETRAGHGRGKPTRMQIEEAADAWTFVTRALDLELGPPFGDTALAGAASAPAPVAEAEQGDKTTAVR